MGNFLKYCIYCLGLVIDAAFGNNPAGLTVERILVGAVVLVVGLGVIVGIVFLLVFLGKASVRTKKQKKQNDEEQK